MPIETEPPSYEESQYSTPIQNQKLKSVSFPLEKKILFEFIEKSQSSEKKILPFSNEHTPSTIPDKTTNLPADSLNNQLERVSSYIQQMIETAQSSLITTTIDTMDSDICDNRNNHLANTNQILDRRQQINKKASIERMRSSQSSLVRTIDQLNASIIQSVAEATTSPLFDSNQQMNNDNNEANNNTTIAFHHHHSNRRQRQQQKDPSSPKQRRSPPSSSAARPSSISVWTKLLTQTALVFCICHCILSWAKLTSSVISATWLVGLLRIKKRTEHTKTASPSFKLSLVPRIYLILLALFGHH